MEDNGNCLSLFISKVSHGILLLQLLHLFYFGFNFLRHFNVKLTFDTSITSANTYFTENAECKQTSDNIETIEENSEMQ